MGFEGLLGPLRVLYLGAAPPSSGDAGPPSLAYEYARRAGDRGWKTVVISADPTVEAWSDVKEAGEPHQWFTRFGVPPSHPGTWSLLAPSTERDRNDPATKFFAATLRELAPDLLHVVDNVHLPLDWPELAAEAGIPVVRTVGSTEDLCALGTPVSPVSGPHGFCDAPLTPEACASCLSASYGPELLWPGPAGLSSSDQTAWLVERLEVKRTRMERQFGSVFDRIVFSTPAWRRYFEATLPLDPDRVRIVEAGFSLELWRNRPARTAKGSDEPVELVLAGSIGPSNGQLDAIAAFSQPQLAARNGYRLRFLGDGDQTLLTPLLRANPNVEACGPYRQQDLPGLLSSADVGLSTSLFEPFDRVAREYLLAGLAVVANPNVGLEGLVVHDENGLFYDRTSSEGLAQAIGRLLDDRALLARLSAGAAATASRIRFLDDEMAEMVGLYAEVVRANRGSPARRKRRPLASARRPVNRT